MGRSRSLFADWLPSWRTGYPMPELPEAEVVAQQLRDRILGAVLKDCWIGRPDIVRQGLSTLDWYRGARIVLIERRGKSVVLTLSRQNEARYLVAELGMTGLLLMVPCTP
ncbi:MAG: hypothetical protein C4293_11080 [Nitrospiraceae bacterium]